MHCDRPPSNHLLLVCRGTTSFAGEEGPKQNRVHVSLETATCPLSPLDAHLAARRKRYSRSMRRILTSPKLRRWSMPKSRLGEGCGQARSVSAEWLSVPKHLKFAFAWAPRRHTLRVLFESVVGWFVWKQRRGCSSREFRRGGGSSCC